MSPLTLTSEQREVLLTELRRDVECHADVNFDHLVKQWERVSFAVSVARQLLDPRHDSLEVDRDELERFLFHRIDGIDEALAFELREQRAINPLDEIAEDFEGWLAHHCSVTGMDPPREGTKARQHVWSMYRARRLEGYQAVEIQLASEGAFGDESGRENGHYGHESVLRPTKISRLIHLGRRDRGGRRATRSHEGWQTRSDQHFFDRELDTRAALGAIISELWA